MTRTSEVWIRELPQLSQTHCFLTYIFAKKPAVVQPSLLLEKRAFLIKIVAIEPSKNNGDSPLFPMNLKVQKVHGSAREVDSIIPMVLTK